LALESAINQTVKCDIIVVDNCSSHNYFKEVCEDKGISYYRNDTNIGLYPNYNKCYSLAKTEFVKILDDDDLLSPNYIETFLKALKQYPDIDVFYTNYLLLSSRGTSNHTHNLPFGYMERSNEIIESGAKQNLGFPYMTAAIKKSIAQLDLDKNICVGGYDWVWVYSQAEKLIFFGELEKLYHYRMHGNKSSRGKDWSANLLTYSYVFETIISKRLFDSSLKKKVSKNIFWDLVNVKAHGKSEVLTEIMNSDNRFGIYLKNKLKDDKILRLIFSLPRLIVCLVYSVKGVLRKVTHVSLKLI
jgi:glycosyltransferase involved in cell wall biosynthesis